MQREGEPEPDGRSPPPPLVGPFADATQSTHEEGVILIVDNRATKGPQKPLTKWLKSAAAFGRNFSVKVVHYADLNWSSCTADWPSKYKGVVLSGHGGGRDKAIANAQRVALGRGPNLPLLGICGGCQLICHAFSQAAGCKVSRLKQVNQNRKRQEEHMELYLFSDMKICGMVTYHRMYGVLPESISERTLQVLCLDAAEETIAAVKHRTKPILGLQGHPEHSTEPVASQCLRTFMRMIDELGEG